MLLASAHGTQTAAPPSVVFSSEPDELSVSLVPAQVEAELAPRPREIARDMHLGDISRRGRTVHVGERDGARRDRNLRAVGRGGAHVVRAQRDGHVRQTCQITKVSAAHAVR